MENVTKEQEKALDVKGEPVAGPAERSGSDAVPAKLSFHDAGVKHANQVAQHDERMAGTQNTIRQQLITILDAPQDAWFTYTDGFKQVLDKRKEEGKPTAALGVLRSQIARVLNAGKRNQSDVKAKLADTKLRWNVMLKALPKVHETKGAPTQSKTAEQTAIEAETNVGTLCQVIVVAAKRLHALGMGHKPKVAYFAAYMGASIVESYELEQAFCLKAIGDNTVAGIIQHDALMKALGLEEPQAEETPAPVAVAA